MHYHTHFEQFFFLEEGWRWKVGNNRAGKCHISILNYIIG